jgi:hypothetical protein
MFVLVSLETNGIVPARAGTKPLRRLRYQSIHPNTKRSAPVQKIGETHRSPHKEKPPPKPNPPPANATPQNVYPWINGKPATAITPKYHTPLNDNIFGNNDVGLPPLGLIDVEKATALKARKKVRNADKIWYRSTPRK